MTTPSTSGPGWECLLPGDVAHPPHGLCPGVPDEFEAAVDAAALPGVLAAGASFERQVMGASPTPRPYGERQP